VQVAERIRLLLLGGTGEAATLAARLADDARIETITSLAGRTRAPAAIAGRVRTGGFSGAGGLAAYLTAEKIDLLIDATHPYAASMPHTAAEACARTGVARLRLLRPAWTQVDGDRWIDAQNMTAAATVLPASARRVFLTTGQRDLAAFALLRETWFLIRLIEPPTETPPLTHHEILLDRGPFSIDGEIALLREHRIEAVVSKNSGGAATTGKIAAARTLGLPVIMIERPAQPEGETAGSVDACLAWLKARLT
jgi:precorrin-6A/cobalt-precorrin-6A reductase